jgi:hypothetical protein
MVPGENIKNESFALNLPTGFALAADRDFVTTTNNAAINTIRPGVTNIAIQLIGKIVEPLINHIVSDRSRIILVQRL